MRKKDKGTDEEGLDFISLHYEGVKAAPPLHNIHIIQ